MDDILVYGSTLEEYDRRLEQVLNRLNIKLNSEKCNYRSKEVCYMGHKLSDKGLKADQKKDSGCNRNGKTKKEKKALQEWLL